MSLTRRMAFSRSATGPWVAARLHHLSGDFAAAWQWQLGGLVLMSLLVLRLDPRGYAKVMRLPASAASSQAQSNTPA